MISLRLNESGVSIATFIMGFSMFGRIIEILRGIVGRGAGWNQIADGFKAEFVFAVREIGKIGNFRIDVLLLVEMHRENLANPARKTSQY